MYLYCSYYNTNLFVFMCCFYSNYDLFLKISTRGLSSLPFATVVHFYVRRHGGPIATDCLPMLFLGSCIAPSELAEEDKKHSCSLMELSVWVRVTDFTIKSKISPSNHVKNDRLFLPPPLRFSVFPFFCDISIMSLNESTSV